MKWPIIDPQFSASKNLRCAQAREKGNPNLPKGASGKKGGVTPLAEEAAGAILKEGKESFGGKEFGCVGGGSRLPCRPVAREQ